MHHEIGIGSYVDVCGAAAPNSREPGAGIAGLLLPLPVSERVLDVAQVARRVDVVRAATPDLVGESGPLRLPRELGRGHGGFAAIRARATVSTGAAVDHGGLRSCHTSAARVDTATGALSRASARRARGP